jgi:hypothetical protein
MFKGVPTKGILLALGPELKFKLASLLFCLVPVDAWGVGRNRLRAVGGTKDALARKLVELKLSFRSVTSASAEAT